MKKNNNAMKKLNLIRLADVKAYIGLLDREEITMSRFAEILNECANEALNIYNINISASIQEQQLNDKFVKTINKIESKLGK